MIKTPFFDSILCLGKEHKSLLRFAAVGVLNTGVDFLTFIVLHACFGAGRDICQAAGCGMGIVNSFAWNRLWTFRGQSSGARMPVQFVEFVGINLFSLVVSLLGLDLLNGRLGIDIYASKVIVTAVVQLFNYAVYKQVIFQQTPVKAGEANPLRPGIQRGRRPSLNTRAKSC